MKSSPHKAGCFFVNARFFRSGLGSYLDDVDGAALFCVHAGFQSFRGGVLLDIRPAVVRDVENGRSGFCAQAAADAAFPFNGCFHAIHILSH